MSEELKEVLRQAVLIVEYRNGDISNEDGSFAVTDLDTIINLESALCVAFKTDSDDATMLEIQPKIDELCLNTRAEGWVSETGHQQITFTVQKFEEEYCITSNEVKGLIIAGTDLEKLFSELPEIATTLIELNKLPLDGFFTPPTE